MNNNENINVPYQVQQLIDDLLNTKENVYLRGNYRIRLESLRASINEAIRKYDNEVYIFDVSKARKKR